MENKESVYDIFLSERARVLEKVKNKSQIEKIITKKVKENMKANLNNFLNVEDILMIDEIKKYFGIIIFNGPRLIGKSFSTKNFLLKRYREHGEKFIWMRNTEAMALDNLDNDMFFWKDCDYEVASSMGAVVTLSNPDKAVNKKNIDDVVGWYLGLRTGANKKSIDFKKAYWINFEEFSDGSNIPNKYGKFTSLVSTIFRLNSKAKVLMSANMISQRDPILATLGMSQKKGDNKLLTFNWIAGSIIWNIPKNHYKKNTADDQLAYRLALAGNIDLFRQEYGGEFNNEYGYNIKKISSFKNVKDLFCLRVADRKITICQNIKNKECYAVDWEQRRNLNIPEFVMNKKDLLQYKTSRIISRPTIDMLTMMWMKEKIYTDEISIAELMIEILQWEMPRNKLVTIIKNV